MRRRVARASALVLLALSLAACDQAKQEAADDFRADVRTEPARTGTIERALTTTGTVRARQDAKVLVETAGKLQLAKNPVTGRRWAVGDAVRQGQLLGVVAAADLRAASRVAARRQALASAQAEYDRNQRLRDEGLVPANTISDQETRLANARADWEAGVQQEGKSRLVAPLTGVLTTVTAAADGEMLNERTLLAEIMDFDDALLDLDLGSGDVLDMQPGQLVRVQPPAHGTDEAAVEGRVERVAPAIDATTRTFRVEVGVPNAAHRLRPGMFVRATVVVEAHDAVTLVPASAVVQREGKPTVFVVDAQRAVQHPVELGLVTQELAEIRVGVKAGEPVVVSGQDTLRDKTRVVVAQ